MGLPVTLIQFRAGTHHPQPLQNMNYSGRGNPPVVALLGLKFSLGFQSTPSAALTFRNWEGRPLLISLKMMLEILP